MAAERTMRFPMNSSLMASHLRDGRGWGRGDSGCCNGDDYNSAAKQSDRK